VRANQAVYVAAGREAILNLLDTEHAATWAEVQAKVADRKWPTVRTRVDPHHLTTARQQLFAQNRIAQSHVTYRGRSIPILHLADLSRRKTAFKRAGARKARLAARFLRWATATTAQPSGLIGTAGERVLHQSLLASGAYGYTLVRPEGGNVGHLLGAPIPGGALDDAAFLQVIRPDGMPSPAILAPFEVKNVRHWLYPSSGELYQLLDKAARLQLANPDIPIFPVLVCRRRHYLTYQLSRALGFYTIETRKQFLLPDPSLTPEGLEEVREELGFFDLTVSDAADDGIVKVLREVMPRVALDNAELWRTTAFTLGDYFRVLRSDISDRERFETYNDMRDEMEGAGIDIEW
jgi:hypothetical protein